MKRCSTCKQEKPEQEFYRNRGMADGKDCYCKVCRLAATQASVNRQRMRLVQTEPLSSTTADSASQRVHADIPRQTSLGTPLVDHHRKEVAKQSRRAVLRSFGLTEEAYQQMFLQQMGRCAICRCKSKRRLCIDHDHRTTHIRGLLCDRCNTALGLLRDSVTLLLSAVEYIEKHEETALTVDDQSEHLADHLTTKQMPLLSESRAVYQATQGLLIEAS